MAAEDEGQQESGSTLRAKLEEALSENKSLKESFAVLSAEKVIRDEGLKYVKPSDLAGVSAAEMVTKGTELNQLKAAEREALLREVLTEKGVPAESLDEALSALASQKPADNDSAAARVASLGSLEGARPQAKNFEGLSGPDLLYAAYTAE